MQLSVMAVCLLFASEEPVPAGSFSLDDEAKLAVPAASPVVEISPQRLGDEALLRHQRCAPTASDCQTVALAKADAAYAQAHAQSPALARPLWGLSNVAVARGRMDEAVYFARLVLRRDQAGDSDGALQWQARLRVETLRKPVQAGAPATQASPIIVPKPGPQQNTP